MTRAFYHERAARPIARRGRAGAGPLRSLTLPREEPAMFAFAHDEERHMLVARMTPPTADTDWSEAIAAYAVLAKKARDARAWAILMVVAEDGADNPNAHWRKQLAESNKRFEKVRFCLVSSSPMTRTVLSLVNWLTPVVPGHRRNHFATFDLAVAWCEADTGTPLPILKKLYERTKSNEKSKPLRG